MFEVCERFNMRLDEYQALPSGERALYNQYTLLRIEQEARALAIKLNAAKT